MASDDENVVGTRFVHEKGGTAFATNCFVVRETVLYWDVAEYRW